MPSTPSALPASRRGHFRMESGHPRERWFNPGRLFGDVARLQPFVADLARRLALHRPPARGR